MASRRPAFAIAYALARRVGLSLHRWPSTRFDSIDDALEILQRAGFRPDVILDVGANLGVWTRAARAFFPDATYHLVEPQSGCVPVLQSLAMRTANVHVHATAVSRPGISTVIMAGGGASNDGGGNFVLAPAVSSAGLEITTHSSTTLDALFGGVRAAHLLVKLDVEGHELDVIEGASSVLARAEVVVTEFWTERPHVQPMPTLQQLTTALERFGLVFYDIAALNGRLATQRLVSGDAIFVRRTSPLFAADTD